MIYLVSNRIWIHFNGIVKRKYFEEVKKKYCAKAVRMGITDKRSIMWISGRQEFFEVFVTLCCRFWAKFLLSIFLFSGWCHYINYCSIYIFSSKNQSNIGYPIKHARIVFVGRYFGKWFNQKERSFCKNKKRHHIAQWFISVSINPY